MSLQTILREEINYWADVGGKTNNRLLKRVAETNLQKRMKQLYSIKVANHKLQKQKDIEMSKVIH